MDQTSTKKRKEADREDMAACTSCGVKGVRNRLGLCTPCKTEICKSCGTPFKIRFLGAATCQDCTRKYEHNARSFLQGVQH